MNGNDAWSAVAELAASQHGVFSKKRAANHLTAQALRRAVKAGRLRRCYASVFAFSDWPCTYEQKVMAVCLTGAVASHHTSARLNRLDGFDNCDLIEVCYPRGNDRSLNGVTTHTWSFTSRHDIATIDGIPCTSIARTLVQLGAVCTPQQVEVALDAALRNGANPKWIEDTMQRLWRKGPTGIQVLADIINDPRRSGPLAESAFERILELVLLDSAMPMPVRQFEIEVASGSRRVDLAFPDVKLAIEAHSRRHHFGLIRSEADGARDLELAAAGWEVLYLTWPMACRPDLFVPLLRATYDQRAALLAPASVGGLLHQ